MTSKFNVARLFLSLALSQWHSWKNKFQSISLKLMTWEEGVGEGWVREKDEGFDNNHDDDDKLLNGLLNNLGFFSQLISIKTSNACTINNLRRLFENYF